MAVGIAPGIMIAMVLYLNEIPDIEADGGAGRRNLPILMGRKRAAEVYGAVESFAIIWILFSALVGITPMATLLALGCLPFAVKAIRVTLRHHDDAEKLIPALGANIATAYVTIALLAAGYLISIRLLGCDGDGIQDPRKNEREGLSLGLGYLGNWRFQHETCCWR